MPYIIMRINELLRIKCKNPLQNQTGNVCTNVTLRQFHVTIFAEDKRRV